MSEMPVAIARCRRPRRRERLPHSGAGGRGSPRRPIDDIPFRGTHEIIQALGQEPRDARVLLWPSTVRLMLTTFLENVGPQDEGRVP